MSEEEKASRFIRTFTQEKSGLFIVELCKLTEELLEKEGFDVDSDTRGEMLIQISMNVLMHVWMNMRKNGVHFEQIREEYHGVVDALIEKCEDFWEKKVGADGTEH